MSKRKPVLAGRRWLHAGKRPETAIGYLCRRGHFVFMAEGPEEDACQSKNAGTIYVRQTQRQGWFDDEHAAIIAEANESLGRHLANWRKCQCDELREQLDAVTATLRRAEAKVVELAAYGEKRYQQWQTAEQCIQANGLGDHDWCEDQGCHTQHTGETDEDFAERFRSQGLEAPGVSRTAEEKIAFRKAWDARYEAGQKRKEGR